MPASILVLPFIYSNALSTAGLMDSFLPLCHHASDVQDSMKPSPHSTPDPKLLEAERSGRKQYSVLVKSRRKVKGRDEFRGGRGGSVFEQTSRKKAIRWTGRTIYSIHAAMSLATRPIRLQTPQSSLHDVQAVSETRLSDGRDFLPVIEDEGDDALAPSSRLREAAEDGFRNDDREGDTHSATFGDSTPDAGCWSSASSSSSMAISPLPDEGARDVLSPSTEYDWSSYASGCEDAGGLRLWCAESDPETVADELFLRFIDVK